MENPSAEVVAEDGSECSSYASPKDHLSVCSTNSENVHHSEVEAPAVDRFKPPPNASLNTTNEILVSDEEEQEEPAVDSDTSPVSHSVRSSGEEDYPDPSLENDLSYAHRSENSTPTRKSLSKAARELTLEGIPQGSEKKLARSLSGLTAEVLGDEGRAGSALEDEKWRKQEKHFFIFSCAGKPIYSRHGDESSLCGIMAIMEAIYSVIQSKGEEAHCIRDGPVKIVFLSEGPVVLVAVSRRKESVKWMQRQLQYLYNHVLCLATGALLNVLKKNPAQDIRNLLKGSSRLTEGLIQDFSRNPGLFLEAFFPIRMLRGIRQNATIALTDAAKACKARCSFLLFGGQVVTMTQDQSNPMHMTDLLLLLNFVLSNELYRSQAAVEFTAPICMPHLHETAFLHAYIYFMEKDPDLVAILLMTQPDGFHAASDARRAMELQLRELGVVHSLKAMQIGDRIFNQGQVQTEELPLAAGGGRRELTALQTFIFFQKTSLCPQFILCQPSQLLNTEEVWSNLIDAISSVHLGQSKEKSTPNQKVYWFVDDKFSILYQCSTDWDLYLVCDAVTLKDHASKIGAEIIRFVLSDQLREELFMASPKERIPVDYRPSL